MKKTYLLSAEIWLYPGMAGWHFITLPVSTADEIRALFSHSSRGFGSLPVTLTMGKTKWKTSLFPDKKSNSYLFPLKAEVRKKEGLKAGDQVKFSFVIES